VFGGGFYDRYLVDYQGKTVSTLSDFQVYDFEPDVFDIPVKELLIFEEHF
ncbi:5-formyltetrahydrofolate cyclo-ligase, partial [Streptococcus suis]